MSNRFNLETAESLCKTFKDAIYYIDSETSGIKQDFLHLNETFTDSGYQEFYDDLQKANFSIAKICDNISDLITALEDYTEGMRTLISPPLASPAGKAGERNQSGKPQNLEDIKSWLSDINPNYDEFDISSPYSNNCGSCAYAIFQRMEGKNHNACASAVNIGFNDQMEALTGLKMVKSTPAEIEIALLSAGNGAHAIIGVDRDCGPGHWFNAVCVNNKVYAIDGQSGKVFEWPPDYGNVVNWEMSMKI